MRSKQDGTGVAPYASESTREIGTLGAGGRGNAVSLKDSLRRGITPALAEQAAEKSAPAPSKSRGRRKRARPPPKPG